MRVTGNFYKFTSTLMKEETYSLWTILSSEIKCMFYTCYPTGLCKISADQYITMSSVF